MDDFDILAALQGMQARWWIAEAEGGPTYREQADAFLERMAADDFPAAIVKVMRRLLAC